jgi:chromosomal replication initiator protein
VSNERLGIVEEAQQRAATYARFIDKRITRTLGHMDLNHMVEKAVNERVKAEVDAIMEKRIAVLRPALEILKPKITLDDVMVAVCAATKQKAQDICGPRRQRKLARPRFLFIWLAREIRTDLSYPRIGHYLGGRDHTTIMNGCRQFLKLKDAAPFAEWLEHPAVVSLLEMPR